MKNNQNNNLYGIVEGFFSRPLPIWSNKERQNIIKFVGERSKDINFYLYCPKQDPYVTEKWDILYPQKEVEDLSKTVLLCQRYQIKFAYAFNPSVPENLNKFSIDVYFKKISRKIDQILNTGIKNIGLLFDDIPQLYDTEDNLKINNEREISEWLVTLANKVYEKYATKLDNYIFCFYDYYFKKESILSKIIKSRLNQNIKIIWTGGDRFVKKATLKNYQTANKITGNNKKIIYWSNYPSNNCESAQSVFNLGGCNNPDLQVYTKLNGILVNPMREAYANLPFLLTFAEYLANPKTYKRSLSLNNAYKTLFGKYWEEVLRPSKEFSYPNIIDKNKFFKTISPTKFISFLEDIKKVQAEKQYFKTCDTYSPLFLETIKPLFRDAKFYTNLCIGLLNNKNISYKEFVKSDHFPEYTKTDRYLFEINKIILKRLRMVELFINKNISNKYLTLKFIINNLEKKYMGSTKLNIKRQESTQMLSLIKEIINWERKLIFMNIVENIEIKPKDKIRLLIERKNINRYSL